MVRGTVKLLISCLPASSPFPWSLKAFSHDSTSLHFSHDSTALHVLTSVGCTEVVLKLLMVLLLDDPWHSPTNWETGDHEFPISPEITFFQKLLHSLPHNALLKGRDENSGSGVWLPAEVIVQGYCQGRSEAILTGLKAASLWATPEPGENIWVLVRLLRGGSDSCSLCA